MELTTSQADLMIEARFREYPELRAVYESDFFDETLAQVLAFEEIDEGYFDDIKFEICLVLSLYAPLNELGSNIAAAVGIPLEKGEDVASMIDTLMLQSVHNDLVAYQHLWEEQLAKENAVPEVTGEVKERLELRPTTVPMRSAPQIPTLATQESGDEKGPLTRTEILQALSPKRTMASDMRSLEKRTGSSAPHTDTMHE